MKKFFIIIVLAISWACASEDGRVQSIAEGGALPPYVYGACNAYVVADREKYIDTFNDDQEKHSRPAVFKLKITDGVPVEVEILMLASDADEGEPLYTYSSDPLNVSIAQQPDILLKDGGRTINRYRGNSEAQLESIDLDWYAEAEHDTLGVERVVQVDFASDPYDNNEGVRRWGKHYVCHHRNVDINALDFSSYNAHLSGVTSP